MALLEQYNSGKTFAVGEGWDEIRRPDELAWPDEELDDLTALKIVTQDRASAASWLNELLWPELWQEFDQVYLFRVPQQMWQGTDIPRASLGMPLVFEHVDSLKPKIMGAIFSSEPPFMFKPKASVPMDLARANQMLIDWELRQSGFKNEIELGIQDMLIYGTAIWQAGWESYEVTRKVNVRKQPYKFEQTPNGSVKVPQPDTDTLIEKEEKTEVNLPWLEHCELQTILVDPSLRHDNIQKAKYVVKQSYLTPLDLDKLRDNASYKIPPREELLRLMFPPAEVPGANQLEQNTILVVNEFRAKPRWEASTVDKLQHPLEVWEYWTADRVITILQGRLVIRNEQNPDGHIPFFSSTFKRIPKSFYGMGIAQLIGNEQRLQQGVNNAFLDDLSLSLNGMYTKLRGANVSTQQIRTRPGGIIETDLPDGVKPMARNPIPVAEVGAILSTSDSRAARRTAANETSVQGVTPSEKSSITRTATGVSSMGEGTDQRIQSVIERFSLNVYVPYLEMVHRMNGRYLKPSQIDSILSQELGQVYQKYDAVDLVNAQGEFDILAAGRLQARAGLKQSLPMLFQFLLTEPVMSALQTEGKKVNVTELVKMTMDVTNYPAPQDLITAMTPADMQRAQANSPQAQQQAQMQHQQAMTGIQTQAKSQLLEQENEDRAGRDVLREQLKKADEGAYGKNAE